MNDWSVWLLDPPETGSPPSKWRDWLAKMRKMETREPGHPQFLEAIYEAEVELEYSERLLASGLIQETGEASST